MQSCYREAKRSKIDKYERSTEKESTDIESRNRESRDKGSADKESRDEESRDKESTDSESTDNESHLGKNTEYDDSTEEESIIYPKRQKISSKIVNENESDQDSKDA